MPFILSASFALELRRRRGAQLNYSLKDAPNDDVGSSATGDDDDDVTRNVSRHFELISRFDCALPYSAANWTMMIWDSSCHYCGSVDADVVSSARQSRARTIAP